MRMRPEWADTLLDDLWAKWGTGEPPNLVWYVFRNSVFSRGQYTHPPGHVILVYAGRDVVDQRATLIHEIAHAVVLEKRSHIYHTPKFYRRFWEIAGEYATPELVTREARLFITSLRIAAEMGVPGGAEGWRVYQETRMRGRVTSAWLAMALTERTG
jgi:hypothetical protein